MRAALAPQVLRCALPCIFGLAALSAIGTADANDRPPRPVLRLSESVRERPTKGEIRRRSHLSVRIPLDDEGERALRAGTSLRLRVGAWDMDLSPTRDARFAAGRRRARLALENASGGRVGLARISCSGGGIAIRVACRDLSALAEDRLDDSADGFFTELRTAECVVGGRVVPIALAVAGFVDWVPEWGCEGGPRVTLQAKGFASTEELHAPYVGIAASPAGRTFDGRLRGFAVSASGISGLSLRVDDGLAVPFDHGPPLETSLNGSLVRMFPFDTLLDATGGHHIVTASARGSGGDIGRSFAPFAMPDPVPLGDLDAGSHVLEIRGEGTVWSWNSYNYYGELGVTAYQQPLSPVPVPGLSGIRSIDAGYYQSLAVDDVGRVWRWGLIGQSFDPDGDWLGDLDSSVPLPVPDLTGVSAAVSGYEFSLALKEDGTVWGWGRNTEGQLLGWTKPFHGNPVRLQGLDRVKTIRPWLALRQDGTAWTWGLNARQFGADGSTPVQVPGVPFLREIAGDSFTVALARDGTVWQWEGWYGWNRAPFRVPELDSISSVTAGADGTALALRADGTVWTWDGKKVSRGEEVPRQVQGLTGVRRIASGDSFSIAESGTGALWVWGYDFLRSNTWEGGVAEPVLAPRHFTGEHVPACRPESVLLLQLSGDESTLPSGSSGGFGPRR